MGVAAHGAEAIAALVAAYRPHAIHGSGRHWPETNCYMDLWIELLHADGFDPLPALAVAVTQDWEGDQFTFTKYHPEDMEILYGLAVQELAIYEPVEVHCARQSAAGRTALVEVDSFFLPDTRGLTYRQEHGKTTIGVRLIDPAGERLAYFHGAGLHALAGEDYRGIFTPRPDRPDILPPYTEFVNRRGSALSGRALHDAARARLGIHLSRRPRANPVTAWRAVFQAQITALLDRPPAFFHQYAFNTARQVGFNWELVGDFLVWLDGEAAREAAACCARMAETAKALQFRLARVIARRRFDPCTELFDRLEADMDQVRAALPAHAG